MNTTLNEIAAPQHPDDAIIDTLPNRWHDADFDVSLTCEEFTCICPLTSQPDYAKIHILYVPKDLIIETRSLKYYLASFRNVGIFHEFAINKICSDLVKYIKPRSIEVIGEFATRGGIQGSPRVRWKE